MEAKIAALIKEIENLSGELFDKNFLLTWEKTDDEIKQTLLVAETLRLLRKENISTRCFDSGLAISQFRDQSTRTRFSFASAVDLLGLQLQDFDEKKSQITHGETVRETSNMISFLSEVVGIRDDIYLGEGNRYMREVADALQDGYNHEVLPSKPVVVNLQCDLDHPTQSMADLLHLKNHFGSLEALRGKKIAMSWAYSPSYGKPLSVPQGIIALMTRLGMNVVLAHPEGYNLVEDVTKLAGENSKKSGGNFQITNSMQEAFKDADIVYPKSWAPYDVMEKRTKLLHRQDFQELNVLEKQCLTNNAKFMDWECNAEKMKLTKNGNALYMHCLPADISDVSCKNGEVSADVFEKYRIDTYKEAGYKPYIIAAMILNSKFKNPATLLKNMLQNKQKRFFE